MLYEYKLREKIHNLKKKKQKPQLNLQLHLNTPTCIWGVRVVKAGQSPLTSCIRPLLWCVSLLSLNITTISKQNHMSHSPRRAGFSSNKARKISPSSLVHFCFKTEQHWMRRKCVLHMHTSLSHYAYKRYEYTNVRIMAPMRR